MKKILGQIVLMLFVLSGISNGQTLDDVISLFNEAAEKTNKADYVNAISDFEKLLDVGEKVGDEANDLVSKAQDQLPVLNWQIAAGHLRQRKFEEAIPLLEKVVDYSTRFNNNPNLKERAQRILPQVYTGVGTQKFRDRDYPEALRLFDKALAVDSEYATALLGKGLIYAEDGDEKKMVDHLEKAIKLAREADDEKTVEMAVTRISRYYAEIGDMELEAMDEFDEDYSFAIEFFKKAIGYDPVHPDANYKLAIIYNKMIEYDLAIEHGNVALTNETDPIKIAAIHLELGYSYSNTAQYDLACASYKNALVGPIEEVALRRMERLPGCD